MPIRFFAPRYWPTWLGLGLLRLFALLPFGGLIRLGTCLGTLLRYLPISIVRTARRNIELCLPELSEAEREKLITAHFQSIGIGVMEIAFTWWAPPERVTGLIQIEGAEHVREALSRGRGVLLLGAHFTTLEIGGRALASIEPTSFLYRPTKNQLVARILARCRCQFGGHAIPRDDIRALITELKRNRCVWYAPDQCYRKKGAQLVELFGIPASTNTFTSRLAQMTGATVLPYFFERLPGTQGYRAIIHPAFDNFPSACSIADSQRFNAMIEAHVRRVPEQYLWVHRRFKGLTPDYPDYYAAGWKKPAEVAETTATASSQL